MANQEIVSSSRARSLDNDTPSLNDIEAHFLSKRAKRYRDLDEHIATQVEGYEPQIEAFLHVASILDAKARVDVLEADIEKDRRLRLPRDLEREKFLGEAGDVLQNKVIEATLAGHKFSGTDATLYEVSGATFVTHFIPELVGAESTLLRISHADPAKPLEWERIGTVDLQSVRKNPDQPTHNQIHAYSMRAVANEFMLRARKLSQHNP